MLRGSDKKNFITGFNYGRCLRPDRPILTENSSDPGFNMGHMLTQRRQGISDQRTAIVGINSGNADFSFGKVNNL